ncbi:MAG: hypothetical protein RQ751_09340 [Longimicrobiales bacterium]|nr:hypothetical protein [Longimicrobiales bacterium]
MTIRAPLHPQGTRVRVRPGRLPLDARAVGRIGTVVATDVYRPGHCGVLLDGDTVPRDFAEAELERAQA